MAVKKHTNEDKGRQVRVTGGCHAAVGGVDEADDDADSNYS